MTQKERWPDFYIVGAPRCGTTFFWEALRHHPRIFMPDVKEPMFFCSDLNTGTVLDRRHFLNETQYLRLFADAPDRALVGEACPLNLFSPTAAQRMAAIRPDARVLIFVRDPVEQMISYHAIRSADGVEDLSFVEAIATQADRAQGQRLPKHAHLVPMYQYVAVASYADQVARYFAAFPREQVHIGVFEEFRRDPGAALRAVISFLGVSSHDIAVPGVVNYRRRVRSGALARFMWSKSVISIGKRLVPRPLHPLAGRAADRLAYLNRELGPRIESEIDPEVRARLWAELAPNVEQLERLVGRDLRSDWSR